MPTSYTIGSHFEALIQRLLKGGRYSTASEVIRDGLRLVEERETLRKAKPRGPSRGNPQRPR